MTPTGNGTVFFLEASITGHTQRWPIPSNPAVVGRDESCDVVIPEPSISRRHLEITIRSDGVVFARDLRSTNGLWNGEKRVVELERRLGEPFIAGAVAVKVCDDEPPPWRTAESRRGQSARTTESQTPLVSAGERRAIASMAKLKSLASELLTTLEKRPLLNLLAEMGQCDGVALLSWIDDAWVLREAVGTAPVVSNLPSRSPGVEKRRIRAATECELLVELTDSVYLWARPWQLDREPPELEFVLNLLRWSIGLEGASSDSSSSSDTEAGPRVGSGFVTASSNCAHVLAEADRLASCELAILICGESGVGKDLLAQRIHQQSGRKGPFIALNCAALSHDLVEAELFGIEDGVATGVRAREGKIVAASGGTLFLDEIADLPPSSQAHLLRVLENGEVTAIGARQPSNVDTRIVSATNVDLRERADQGTFRTDLFYRLNGAVLRLPALRERPEDVLPLVHHLAKAHLADKAFEGIEPDALQLLLAHEWPGNVRELKHVIVRALELSPDAIVKTEHLPEELRKTDPAVSFGGPALEEGSLRGARTAFERLYLLQLIERCGGNMSKASRLAGVSRSSLYRKLDELGIR